MYLVHQPRPGPAFWYMYFVERLKGEPFFSIFSLLIALGSTFDYSFTVRASLFYIRFFIGSADCRPKGKLNADCRAQTF